MNIIAITGTAIAAAALSVILRQYNKEYSLYISLAVSIIIFLAIIGSITPVVELIQELSSFSKIEPQYLSSLLKALSISYITQLASDCCKDSGENAIASKIDLAGKIAILLISVPLFDAIIGIVKDLIIDV